MFLKFTCFLFMEESIFSFEPSAVERMRIYNFAGSDLTCLLKHLVKLVFVGNVPKPFALPVCLETELQIDVLLQCTCKTGRLQQA